MVEKVAKVRALRETFIEELGGMYEADEMEIPEIKNEKPIEQNDVIETDYREVSMDEL